MGSLSNEKKDSMVLKITLLGFLEANELSWEPRVAPATMSLLGLMEASPQHHTLTTLITSDS